jgi:hypothetical protein
MSDNSQSALIKLGINTPNGSYGVSANNIILSQASNHRVPVENFVAAWIIWVERFHLSTAWEEFHFPFDWQKEILAILLIGGRHSGLDAMVRFLAPPSARNTMQISDAFLTVNAQWLSKCDDALSSRGNKVLGGVLTEASIGVWKALSQQNQDELLKETNQLASDFFETVFGIEEEVDSEEENISNFDIPNSDSSIPSLGSGVGWVQKFVEMVNRERFDPQYRRKSLGSAIYGWGNRLNAYFWPTPVCGLSVTTAALSSHTGPLQHLANKVLVHAPWTPADDTTAVACAKGIFHWGRVLRGTPTASEVRAAMEMAIHGSTELKAPPMNSTWTKLAAFSTEHLANPHVIWDSRVATSVTWRLEQLFLAAGHSTVPYGSPEIPRNLGPMQVGRGGTRPRNLKLNWRNAYGRWEAQFAASEFVRLVRDHLNANKAIYPKHAPAPWTVREVEQVLFMDGY